VFSIFSISLSVSVSVDEFLPIKAHLNKRGRLIHHNLQNFRSVFSVKLIYKLKKPLSVILKVIDTLCYYFSSSSDTPPQSYIISINDILWVMCIPTSPFMKTNRIVFGRFFRFCFLYNSTLTRYFLIANRYIHILWVVLCDCDRNFYKYLLYASLYIMVV
jgi:hypothetical protein